MLSPNIWAVVSKFIIQNNHESEAE